MTIGQRMRDRRIQLNINPKDIAEKIGKSVSTYYRYETGEIEKLTISKMCEIADYLQVSPVFLLLGLEPDTQYNLSKKIDINNHTIIGFSRQFKRLRQINNISLNQLAERLKKEYNLNLSVKELNDWENGIQSPDIISFMSIAELFNVSVDCLLDRKTRQSIQRNYPKVSETSAKYNEESFVVKNLKSILSSCNLSFDELTEKTKIDKNKLESYMKGTASNVEIYDIQAISKVLNISIIDILYERDTGSLFEKLSTLNAVELRIVEEYVDKILNK